MAWRAAEPFHPTLDIGVEALRVGEIAAAREDHFGSFRRDLAAGVGGARLNDDRPALDRTSNVERAAHRKNLALVVEHMQTLGIEIDTIPDIADEGVVG